MTFYFSSFFVKTIQNFSVCEDITLAEEFSEFASSDPNTRRVGQTRSRSAADGVEVAAIQTPSQENQGMTVRCSAVGTSTSLQSFLRHDVSCEEVILDGKNVCKKIRPYPSPLDSVFRYTRASRALQAPSAAKCKISVGKQSAC